MAVGITLNSGAGSTSILAVKASKKGKVGSTCPVDYEAATDGSAKGIWSNGTSLTITATSPTLTSVDADFATTDASLTTEDICDVPVP